MFILSNTQWTFLKLTTYEDLLICSWLPCIDMTIKSPAAEMKVSCETISWYMVLTENMTFAVSVKLNNLKKAYVGKIETETCLRNYYFVDSIFLWKTKYVQK